LANYWHSECVLMLGLFGMGPKAADPKANYTLVIFSFQPSGLSGPISAKTCRNHNV